MFKFNSDNIITGYIKQLLKNTLIPSIRILSKDKPIFSDVKYIYNNELYIYDFFGQKNKYCKAISSEQFDQLLESNSITRLNKVYLLESDYLNSTQKFKISNNIYDTYTHEYLGKYLRYIRDTKNINLMSMYNCFSNNIVNNIDIASKETDYFFNFNSKDPNYVIYAIPVKLLENYTVAITANRVECVLCEYDSGKIENYVKGSYMKQHFTNFKKPFLYDRITKTFINSNYNIEKNLVHNEDNIRLLLKIPVNTRSSIVVLEGDYIQSTLFTTENDSMKRKESELQLLYFNDSVIYPFADRLIEYLFDQSISPLNDYPENFKYITNYETQAVDVKSTIFENTKIPFWSENIEHIIKNIQNKYNLNNKYLDLLPYLDKDTAMYVKEE